jgi:hypothetical protein
MATTRSFARSTTSATAILAVPRGTIGGFGSSSSFNSGVDYYKVQVRGATARSLQLANTIGYDPRSNFYFLRSDGILSRRGNVALLRSDGEYRIISGLYQKTPNTFFVRTFPQTIYRRNSFFHDSFFNLGFANKLVLKVNQSGGRQFFY